MQWLRLSIYTMYHCIIFPHHPSIFMFWKSLHNLMFQQGPNSQIYQMWDWQQRCWIIKARGLYDGGVCRSRVTWWHKWGPRFSSWKTCSTNGHSIGKGCAIQNWSVRIKCWYIWCKRIQWSSNDFQFFLVSFIT